MPGRRASLLDNSRLRLLTCVANLSASEQKQYVNIRSQILRHTLSGATVCSTVFLLTLAPRMVLTAW
jgi:hypothetical protein